MPGHTSREVVIIFSSLTTCDPANIYELIKVRLVMAVTCYRLVLTVVFVSLSQHIKMYWYELFNISIRTYLFI